MPWISLLKCCQPTVSDLNKVCHDTLHDLECNGWCVRTLFWTQTAVHVSLCMSGHMIHYFTFEISVCVSMSVHVCAWSVFAHSEHLSLCFNNLSKYILCLLTCVTQPLSTGNSKSSEVAPFTICITCQLSLQWYRITQCPRGWLEILSDSKSKTSVKFHNQHLSHKHYRNRGNIWELRACLFLVKFQSFLILCMASLFFFIFFNSHLAMKSTWNETFWRSFNPVLRSILVPPNITDLNMCTAEWCVKLNICWKMLLRLLSQER